jgi:GH3 auxin-responsive promoter
LVLDTFRVLLDDWYDALKNPVEAQQAALKRLLLLYSKSEYGKEHHASDAKSIVEFQTSFPVTSFDSLQPLIARVRKGDYEALLPEPPTGWVMTRGSTGPAKVIPITQTQEDEILSCGARGFLNYALRREDTEVLGGGVLNLSFPSEVHELEFRGQKVRYGYSSGTYSKLHPGLGSARLIPRQEEIDALGGGIGREDWERRFEFTYQRTMKEDVRSGIGVAPVFLAFARFLKRKHNMTPSRLWKMRALFLTSVPKIQFKYGPGLRALYGASNIVEIYSATEGVFAQQKDELPYVTPNYDTYLFEVRTGRGVKMLHEMKRGEWGSIIISSCLFPRYDIGDLIECMGSDYYRVFGRKKLWPLLEHWGYRALTRWFT